MSARPAVIGQTVHDVEASTRERVLELIVERGPVSAAMLAKNLDLTPAAVRRHLGYLEDAGQIVVHEPAARGARRRGRPARYYVATDAGRAGLTDSYSDLATHVLDFLQHIGGDSAMEAFAADRVRELERRYRPVVEQAGESRAARVEALAEALTADGYAATTRSIGSQAIALQLCQGHCPVQDVAGQFPQLCEAEAQAFSQLLDVHVQRLSTLAAGGHVCTTHIPLAVPGLRPGAAPTTIRAKQPSPSLPSGAEEGNS